jgi:glycosyltransferase involved in cell wall biosynthesis
MYAEAFPASAAKLHVIPPLVALPPAPEPPSHRDGRIRLAFVGTLYGGIRRPDFLLRLFDRLLESDLGPQLELHFYGDTHACSESFRRHAPRLGSHVILHGPVPRQAALQALGGASVLVNIGNATAHQLPSKVIEYAATGKPILSVGLVDADPSAAALDDYPARLCLSGRHDEPTEAQVTATLDFLRHLPADASSERLRAWVEPYTLPTISRQYLDLLFPLEASGK